MLATLLAVDLSPPVATGRPGVPPPKPQTPSVWKGIGPNLPLQNPTVQHTHTHTFGQFPYPEFVVKIWA